MPRVYLVDSDALNEPSVQLLSDRQFRRAFLDALDGRQSEFSPFVKLGSDRPAASAWARIRSFIFARDDFTCRYCGARGGKLQCDHIVPVSKGGGHEDSNLVTACEPCNRSKGSKLLTEWRR